MGLFSIRKEVLNSVLDILTIIKLLKGTVHKSYDFSRATTAATACLLNNWLLSHFRFAYCKIVSLGGRIALEAFLDEPLRACCSVFVCPTDI